MFLHFTFTTLRRLCIIDLLHIKSHNSKVCFLFLMTAMIWVSSNVLMIGGWASCGDARMWQDLVTGDPCWKELIYFLWALELVLTRARCYKSSPTPESLPGFHLRMWPLDPMQAPAMAPLTIRLWWEAKSMRLPDLELSSSKSGELKTSLFLYKVAAPSISL